MEDEDINYLLEDVLLRELFVQLGYAKPSVGGVLGKSARVGVILLLVNLFPTTSCPVLSKEAAGQDQLVTTTVDGVDVVQGL